MLLTRVWTGLVIMLGFPLYFVRTWTLWGAAIEVVAL
jgi:hypothetical protein